jgi:hypothetical protein
MLNQNTVVNNVGIASTPPQAFMVRLRPERILPFVRRQF